MILEQRTIQTVDFFVVIRTQSYTVVWMKLPVALNKRKVTLCVSAAALEVSHKHLLAASMVPVEATGQFTPGHLAGYADLGEVHKRHQTGRTR